MASRSRFFPGGIFFSLVGNVWVLGMMGAGTSGVMVFMGVGPDPRFDVNVSISFRAAVSAFLTSSSKVSNGLILLGVAAELARSTAISTIGGTNARAISFQANSIPQNLKGLFTNISLMVTLLVKVVTAWCRVWS